MLYNQLNLSPSEQQMLQWLRISNFGNGLLDFEFEFWDKGKGTGSEQFNPYWGNVSLRQNLLFLGWEGFGWYVLSE